LAGRPRSPILSASCRPGNFYTFGDRHSCFTTGFAVFMRYVCMDTLGCHDDEQVREAVAAVDWRQPDLTPVMVDRRVRAVAANIFAAP
jgi:hypothetical protein